MRCNLADRRYTLAFVDLGVAGSAFAFHQHFPSNGFNAGILLISCAVIDTLLPRSVESHVLAASLLNVDGGTDA